MTAGRIAPPREPSLSTGQPLVLLICQVLVAATLGLVVLPSIFSDPIGAGTSIVEPVRLEAAIWLGCGVVLGIWLIAIGFHLARALSRPLGFAPWRGSRRDDDEIRTRDAHYLAVMLVAVIGATLIAAVLRRPLVEVAATLASPLEVDAIVATASVTIILALSVRLYFATRPFVEGSAWLALDAVVPTSGSEAANQFSRGFDSTAQPRTVPWATSVHAETVPGLVPTVLAGELDQTRPAGDATYPDATIPASGPAPDETVLDPRVAGDATVAAPPPISPSETVPSWPATS